MKKTLKKIGIITLATIIAVGNKIDQTSSKASVNSSTSTVLVTVSGNKYAIGYVSLGSLNDTVKAIKINGVEPSVENINNGTYEIARPFNIATKGEVSEVTKDFINYIMSAEGQAIVEEKGYIKVADAESFTSNGATGIVKIEGSSSVSPVMEKLAEAYKSVNTGATDLHRGALVATGVVLFVFVLIINLVMSFIKSKGRKG